MNFLIKHSSAVIAFDNNELIVVSALWAINYAEIDVKKCRLFYNPAPYIFFGIKTYQKHFSSIIYDDSNGPPYNHFSSMDVDNTIHDAKKWILKNFQNASIKVVD